MSHSCPNIKDVGLEDAEFSIPGIREHKYAVKAIDSGIWGGKRRLESKMFTMEMLYERIHPLSSQQRPCSETKKEKANRELNIVLKNRKFPSRNPQSRRLV